MSTTKAKSIMFHGDHLFPEYPNNYAQIDNTRIFSHYQLNHLLSRKYMRNALKLSASSIFIDHSEYMRKLMEPDIFSMKLFVHTESCKNNLSLQQLKDFGKRFAQNCHYKCADEKKYLVYYAPLIFRNGDTKDSEIILSVTYFADDKSKAVVV